MSRSDNFPIKKTGNVDNERVQINKALADIFETLARSGEWDGAFEWGDHNKAGYATELTETEQFEALGLPQNLQLTEEIVVSANGTERNTVEATWLKVPDDTILYDLEIRQSDPATVIDATDPVDILNNTTMFTVAIVGNEEADSNITFNIFLDGGVRYWFRLRIRKDSLVSPWTDFENVTTSLATAQPDPPQSLTIEPIIEGALVKWTIPTDSAIIEKTEVYRREVGQTTDPVVAEVAKPGNTFTDADLSSSITYEYKVASVSFRGVESNPTGWISVQPLPVEADFVTPAVPANLSATQELVTDNTGGQAFVTIDVSWDVVAGDNITYDLDIVRGGSVQVNTPVISNPASGSRVNYEFQVPVGTVLAIKVRSRNATSVSAFTATLNITANADATGVDAVGNLQAKPLYQGALVSWDNPANVNYKYAIVERRRTAPSFVDYVEIGKVVRPSSFLFDDVGELSLDANDNVVNLYDYRVTGYSSANEPGPSMVKEDIKPLNVPPDSITADQIVANTITAQEIKGGTITATEIDVANLTANNLFISNVKTTVNDLGVNATFIQTSEPTTRVDGSPLQIGDVWYDTTIGQGDKPYTYKGVSLGWVPAYTVIDGGNITTGTINASLVDVTNLNATNITTGTLSADRLATSVLLVGDNISELTNDAGFTDFSALDVQAAIDNNVTVISGSKITTGTIDASQATITNLNATNITTGTLSADRLSTNVLLVGANISDLNNNLNFTDFDALDVQSAIDNNVTVISGSKITTGTIDASQATITNLNATNITTGTLNVDRIASGSLGSVKFANDIQSDPFTSGSTGWRIRKSEGDAEFNNLLARGTVQSTVYTSGSDGWIIGANGAAEFSNIVARGNIFAASSASDTGERVEITINDPNNYRIWIGAGAKNDTNGVFWVKSDGSVKIDKNTFGIGAQPNKGAASSGNITAGVTQTVNPVTATFTEFESNGQDTLVSVTFDYFARKETDNPTTCPIPTTTTGTLVLQRSLNNGATWTTATSSSFNIATSSSLLDDPDPSIPLKCIQESNGAITRDLVDSSAPADGTNVRYRVIISPWSNFFLSSASQIIFNELNISYLQ